MMCVKTLITDKNLMIWNDNTLNCVSLELLEKRRNKERIKNRRFTSSSTGMNGSNDTRIQGLTH